MKVTKHYEHDHVILYVTEGDSVQTTVTLDTDRQMRQLGECLIDLDRTGGRYVSIGDDETK